MTTYRLVVRVLIPATSDSPILDIKSLTITKPGLLSKLDAAFEKYNEEQFTTVKLPGGSQQVRGLGSPFGRKSMHEV